MTTRLTTAEFLAAYDPTTRKQRARPRSREHDEQCRVIRWARANADRYPQLALLHAIPNGGHRTAVTAAKMKAEGALAGVPDLSLPCARGKHHGLYIELKTEDRKPRKGGAGGLTREQRVVIERLRWEGYAVVVAYGAQEAIDALEKYLTTD